MAEDTTQEESDDYSHEGGVVIPEEFQKKVVALVEECDSKECLDFIRSCVYSKEDEMREKSKKDTGPLPSVYSAADMPE